MTLNLKIFSISSAIVESGDFVFLSGFNMATLNNNKGEDLVFPYEIEFVEEELNQRLLADFQGKWEIKLNTFNSNKISVIISV